MSKKLSKLITNLIELKEMKKYSFTNYSFKSGDCIQIIYKTVENDKEKILTAGGIIMRIQNSGPQKSILLRRFIAGVGVEQIFFLNSPLILAIKKKDTFKIRRARIYYIRKKILKH